jgi:hypothetical protein
MHVALPLICSFLHAFEQVMPLMTHISRGFVVVTYKRVILIIIMIRWGKAMANYPQELAQDAVCQSHTGHMTGLWFLPTRPLRLNANE